LQIQILGVQKCSKDQSPYVRKCAANALAKLSPRCDDMQREMLLEILKTFLDTDTCTMVLSSAVVAVCELCPERLDLLHTSYRKICHLLTDMDEWGQVVIIDLLARYCRAFFKQPKGWKGGTAEKIDRERRVRRRIKGALKPSSSTTPDVGTATPGLLDMTGNAAVTTAPKKTKRRVVQKGFYSDEEDESGEEEVYAESPLGPPLSTATAMRQRNILGVPGVQPISVDMNADEDMDLDEDHRLLLQSSMSLLKSRNAGVVLSVCSLLYYCGVSSVKTRSAVGKALVRIHRDRREIQYVVLSSIRTLVTECPSAFAPFLNDFYVKVS
jgi:AP-3 complex subunit beta